MRKILIIAVVIIIGIFSSYQLLKTDISFPEIPVEQSDTISFVPNKSRREFILMDFSKCTPGRQSIGDMWTTYFYFEGISNNNCVFYYGRSYEDSGTDKFTKCVVPTSMGEKKIDNTTLHPDERNGYDLIRLGYDDYCIEDHIDPNKNS